MNNNVYYLFLGPRDVIKLVQDIGFEAELFDRQTQLNDFASSYLSHQQEINKWRNSFLISLIFGLPCMIIMVYFMVEMSDPSHNHKDDCCVLPGLLLITLHRFILANFTRPTPRFTNP